MLDVVYQCSEALLERSGQSGFQILWIQSRVRPGDRNNRNIDIRKDGKIRLRIDRIQSKRMRMARTTNVYGRLRANLTIHMDSPLVAIGFIGRFDVAAHATSSFRSLPKPEQPFLWHLFRPVHVRCILRPFGLILLALARLCTPLIPKPWRLGMCIEVAKGVPKLTSLFRWRGQFAVAPSGHTLLGLLTMLRTHGCRA
jgi:hypothetical protein